MSTPVASSPGQQAALYPSSQLLALWFLLPPYIVLFLMFLHAIKGHSDFQAPVG